MERKRSLLLRIGIILLLSLFLWGMFSNEQRVSAHEMKKSLLKSDINVLVEDGNKDDDGTITLDNLTKLIEGQNGYTNVKYIDNANYFMVNPLHAYNDGTDNAGGTCTTVAMQLLMGYHNYYSDRRIIPKTANGKNFLAEDYGELEGHPLVDGRFSNTWYQENSVYKEAGRPSIGTKHAFYKEIFDLTWFSDWYGIGQAVGLVCGGAEEFIKKYSNAIENKVLITNEVFSDEQAKQDINFGRPIILGFNPIFSDAETFHIVVAYGYATYNGVPGYIVHYGRMSSMVHTWVPTSWFGYQIRMSVDHEHTLYTTGNIINGTFQEVRCNVCGYSGVDDLFEINSVGNEIIGIKHDTLVSGQLTIPSMINNTEITAIGENAFANQTNIEQVFLPDTIIEIGDGAFKNCTNLMHVYGELDEATQTPQTNKVRYLGDRAFEGCEDLMTFSSTELVSVGDFAFKDCFSLPYVVLADSVTYIGEGAIMGCDNASIAIEEGNTTFTTANGLLMKNNGTIVIGSANVPDVLTIPSTVTSIYPYAFATNYSVDTVIFNNPAYLNDYAFYASGLSNIYYYTYEAPNVGDNSVMRNSSVNIYVPYSKQGDFSTAFSEYNCNITSLPITVTFNSEGETVATQNTYYGAILSQPQVSKTGYSIEGWYDNEQFNGTPVISGGYLDFNENVTLYAKWTANSYTLTFAGDGVTSIPTKSVEYDSAVGELPVPSREGYEFVCWKDQYGATYTATSIWQTPNDGTLYAQWNEVVTIVQTNVTLDKQGGSNGSDEVVATNGEAMPTATAPTKTGYTFQGYYANPGGLGANYYNADMSSVNAWDMTAPTATLYAYWTAKEYTVLLNANGGTGGTASVVTVYDSSMPTATAPTKTGYTFQGYFSNADGSGVNYYDKNMNSLRDWDIDSSTTLYAKWTKNYYTLTISQNYEGLSESLSIGYGEQLSFSSNYNAQFLYNRVGYDFSHFSLDQAGNNRIDYITTSITTVGGEACYKLSFKPITMGAGGWTVYAQWKVISCTYSYDIINGSDGSLVATRTVAMTHGSNVVVTAPTIDGYTYTRTWINGKYYPDTSNTIQSVQLKRNLNNDPNVSSQSVYLWYPSMGSGNNQGGLFMEYAKNECVAKGTMITLADGTQKAVEELTGNELLLVWNLHTGSFDTAPILFVDSDPTATYRVINLTFSDGTTVKVIGEHGFWDITLNRYVYLRCDAEQYVGHYFRKTNGSVQLTSVEVCNEVTSAWSPVTAGHLCYYVNGMLSMPGGIEGLFNIFEVDEETMAYDSELMASDIAQYGLYTYEEFYENFAISEEAFEAFNGRYLKVAIGKGILSEEEIARLIQTYSEFLG